MDWYKKLPHELLDAAYTVGSEKAWPRDYASQVINFLSKNGYIVVGIDIWVPTKHSPTVPTPYVYDWSLEHSNGQSAQQFVEFFEWNPDDKSHNNHQPVFNIWADRIMG